MLAHRTLAWLLTVGTLSAATISGCSSPDTEFAPSRSSGLTESNVELRVALGPSGLKLIDVAPVPSLVLPVAEHELEAEHALHWTFVGASGERAEGDVPDPRIVRFEAHDHGHNGGEFRAEGGLLRIVVPEARGQLTLDTSGGPMGLAVGNDASLRTMTAADGGATTAPAVLLGQAANECAGAVKMIISSEGYTAAELPAFREHARNMVEGLFRLPDFTAHRDQFEIYLNEVPSNESGIGERNAPKDTAFRMEHGGAAGEPLRRLVWSRVGFSLRGSQRWAAAQTQVGGELHVILANTTEHGGAARAETREVMLTNNPSSAPMLAHEIGHALVWLADEYAYAEDNRCNVASAGGRANTDKNGQRPKWSSFLSTPAVEGAEYCGAGVFRPTDNCLMRSLGEPRFCPVCRRAFDALLYQRATEVRRTRSGCPSVPPTGISCNTLGRNACGLARVCAWNGTTYCCKASAPAPSGATRCTRDADCANDQVCAQTAINAQTMNCVPRGTGACEGAR